MGSASNLTTTAINGFRASGFTTLILFTMTVQSDGTFTYSDGVTVCSNGVYAGPTNWGSLLTQCKAAPSSVTRIEMSIAGWGDPSFANIKARIQADGTNATTILYRNLQAMRNALPIDAMDYDDESTYDSASSIQFGSMCNSLGMKVTLCPYTSRTYWQAVKNGLGTNCDQVYLQCYDGGAGNSPATWNTYFGALKVIMGYWDNERDTTFITKMQQGKNAGCPGGFLWASCTGCNPPAGAGELSQYAAWIQNTFSSVTMPITAADVIGGKVTFTASSFVGSGFSYQWQVIKAGATNPIPGATSLSLTLTNLQLTNTAAYQLRASNTSGILFSSASSLTVSSVPAPFNNVITTYAGQTGLGYGFPLTPSWTLDSASLIRGQSPAGTNGNYNLESQWGTRSVSSLTAGGSLTLASGGSSLTCSSNYVTCGNGSSAGSWVIYSLTNLSASGYSLTNVAVYGGWADAGRDQQAYVVSYSTISAPSNFIALATVNYNPANASNTHSVTRAMLSPANGFLAANVAALKFDFTSPASENGYCGYAQLQLFGTPSISPTGSVSRTVSLLPTNAVWKFFDRTNDLGTAWRSNSFDDSTWRSGPSMLGVGDANGLLPTTVIASNRQWTSYFRRELNIPNASQVQPLTARIMRDDAAVVYLNGMEVWRDTNITTGTISYNTPATVALGGADESAWLSFPLNPAALVSGTNLLAIEVHQNAVTSSDLIMNFDLTGTALLPVASKISITGTTLSWPVEAGWLWLYATTNLTLTNSWLPVASSGYPSNGAWHLALPPATNEHTFYRLEFP